MKKLVTISREYGSGGRIIGKILAQKLEVPFYDKEELIDLAAERSGFSKELLAGAELKAKNSFAYNLSSALSFNEATSGSPLSVNEKLFLATFQTIREIGEKGEAVIVGRCADYVLKDEDVNKISIFITAPAEARADRIMKTENLSNMQAKSFIKKTDTRRKNYYNYFSKQKWGGKDNYDMTINSHSLGIEGTTDLICQIYKNYLKKE